MASVHRIIYSGQLTPGSSHQKVVTELARTFHMTEDEARELIDKGAGRVIKHDLDAAQVRRYRDALTAVGLGIAIDPPLETADLSLAQGSPQAPSGNVPVPRARPAGRGWSWIAEAWGLFKDSPIAWILALILFIAILMVLGLIPVVGGIATTLIGPILTGGLMLGARAQDQGEGFRIQYLFAGFSTRTGPLVLLGVIFLLLGLLVALVMGVLFALMLGLGGSDVLAPGMLLSPAQAETWMSTLTILPVLVTLLLVIPVIMAMYFAPLLVALDGVEVIESLRLSLLGCLRNILPFLVSGGIALVLLFIGALPILLGWLVVVPVLSISVYTAYRDIFQQGDRD